MATPNGRNSHVSPESGHTGIDNKAVVDSRVTDWPFMMMNDPFSHMRLALLGMKVSNIWRGHGSAVFVEFGKLTPHQRRNGTQGHPWGEISVGLEFHWRIELGRAIVCGSAGTSELWDAHFNRVHGAVVIDLALHGIVPELCLELSTGHRFITCSLYEDGPDWALTDRRNPVARWVTFEDGQIVESDGLKRSA